MFLAFSTIADVKPLCGNSSQHLNILRFVVSAPKLHFVRHTTLAESEPTKFEAPLIACMEMQNSSSTMTLTVADDAAGDWFVPSPQLLMLCSVVRCLELLVHLLLVPVSIVFVILIVRTSVLHRNLKFILLCQCWSNLQYGTSRYVQILNKLLFGVDFFAALRPIQMSVLFTELLGSMIGHALLLERILATIFVSKYENHNKPYFSILSFIIMTALSLENAYQQAFGDSVLDVTLGTLSTLYATLALSLAEIAIIVAVGYYNDNRYKLGVLLSHKHSLSVRYQLSENIRTGRQLLPTFVFHFINILVTNGITIVFYYFKLQVHAKDAFLIDFLFLFVFSITAFCNFAIEVSVIIYHPILHRNLNILLRQWREKVFGARTAKVADSNLNANGQGTKRTSPRTIDGRALIERTQQQEDQYFQMLRTAWA